MHPYALRHASAFAHPPWSNTRFICPILRNSHQRFRILNSVSVAAENQMHFEKLPGRGLHSSTCQLNLSRSWPKLHAKHPLISRITSSTPPRQPPNAPPIPPNALTLSRKVDECKPLLPGRSRVLDACDTNSLRAGHAWFNNLQCAPQLLLKKDAQVMLLSNLSLEQAAPARYCSPRHAMPFNSRSGDSKCVPMTWRAIFARALGEGSVQRESRGGHRVHSPGSVRRSPPGFRV